MVNKSGLLKDFKRKSACRSYLTKAYLKLEELWNIYNTASSKSLFKKLVAK